MKRSSIPCLVIAISLVGCNQKPATSNSDKVNAKEDAPVKESNSESSAARSSTPPAAPKTPATASSVPTIPQVDSAGKGGWKPSPKPTPVETRLAQVDRELKGLTNVKFKMFSDVRTPVGSGFNDLESVIRDQKSNYLLRYATWNGSKTAPRYETYTVAKVNGKIQTLVGKNFVPKRINPAGNILEKFVQDHSHYVASAIGTPMVPFTQLAKAAKSAGWKTSLEVKKYDFGTFERVLFENPKNRNQKIEIVISNEMSLPVSIQTQSGQGKKLTQIASKINWAKSTTTVTDQELSPNIAAPPVKVVEPGSAESKKLQDQASKS